MPKLFITDIDGTILKKGECTVSGEVREFFSELAENGVTAAVASGRSYDSIERVFGGDIPDTLYVISNDGALCTLAGRHLFGKPLSQSSCAHFFDEAKRHGGGFFCAAGKAYIYGGATRFTYAPEFALTGISVTNVYGISESVYKIGIDISDGKETGMCPSDARCAYDDGILREYVSRYADKGNALEALSQRLFCHREDIFALGDGPNDVSMFKKSKYSAFINKGTGETESFASLTFADCGEAMEYYRNNLLTKR